METQMHDSVNVVNCTSPVMESRNSRDADEKKSKNYIMFGSIRYTYNKFSDLCTESSDVEAEGTQNQFTESEHSHVVHEEKSDEASPEELINSGDQENSTENESIFIQQHGEIENRNTDFTEGITNYFELPVIVEESEEYLSRTPTQKDAEIATEESLKDSIEYDKLDEVETKKEEENEIAEIIDKKEENPFVEVVRRKRKGKKNRRHDISDELDPIPVENPNMDRTEYASSNGKENTDHSESLKEDEIDDTAEATKKEKKNKRNQKKRMMKKASKSAKELALASACEMRKQAYADQQIFKMKGKIKSGLAFKSELEKPNDFDSENPKNFRLYTLLVAFGAAVIYVCLFHSFSLALLRQ